MKINVLLADDHDLVRTGIKHILVSAEDIYVVGEADSGEAAIAMVKQHPTDIILMDLRMPGMGGIKAIQTIHQEFPQVKIIAITAYDEETLASRLLQEGVMAYLTKGCSGDEILTAIRRVYNGERYIDPQIAPQLAIQNANRREASPVELLSERELQVMLLLVKGKSIQAISETLHLSPKTVNTYRYRLLEKLQVDSNVELAHLAIRYGLLSEASEP